MIHKADLEQLRQDIINLPHSINQLSQPYIAQFKNDFSIDQEISTYDELVKSIDTQMNELNKKQTALTNDTNPARRFRLSTEIQEIENKIKNLEDFRNVINALSYKPFNQMQTFKNKYSELISEELKNTENRINAAIQLKKHLDEYGISSIDDLKNRVFELTSKTSQVQQRIDGLKSHNDLNNIGFIKTLEHQLVKDTDTLSSLNKLIPQMNSSIYEDLLNLDALENEYDILEGLNSEINNVNDADFNNKMFDLIDKYQQDIYSKPAQTKQTDDVVVDPPKTDDVVVDPPKTDDVVVDENGDAENNGASIDDDTTDHDFDTKLYDSIMAFIEELKNDYKNVLALYPYEDDSSIDPQAVDKFNQALQALLIKDSATIFAESDNWTTDQKNNLKTAHDKISKDIAELYQLAQEHEKQLTSSYSKSDSSGNDTTGHDETDDAYKNTDEYKKFIKNLHDLETAYNSAYTAFSDSTYSNNSFLNLRMSAINRLRKDCDNLLNSEALVGHKNVIANSSGYTNVLTKITQLANSINQAKQYGASSAGHDDSSGSSAGHDDSSSVETLIQNALNPFYYDLRNFEKEMSYAKYPNYPPSKRETKKFIEDMYQNYERIKNDLRQIDPMVFKSDYFRLLDNKINNTMARIEAPIEIEKLSKICNKMRDFELRQKNDSTAEEYYEQYSNYVQSCKHKYGQVSPTIVNLCNNFEDYRIGLDEFNESKKESKLDLLKNWIFNLRKPKKALPSGEVAENVANSKKTSIIDIFRKNMKKGAEAAKAESNRPHVDTTHKSADFEQAEENDDTHNPPGE